MNGLFEPVAQTGEIKHMLGFWHFQSVIRSTFRKVGGHFQRYNKSINSRTKYEHYKCSVGVIRATRILVNYT